MYFEDANVPIATGCGDEIPPAHIERGPSDVANETVVLGREVGGEIEMTIGAASSDGGGGGGAPELNGVHASREQREHVLAEASPTGFPARQGVRVKVYFEGRFLAADGRRADVKLVDEEPAGHGFGLVGFVDGEQGIARE